MSAYLNEKGRQTKLLAAIAILAMVVCAFAIAMPSTNANEAGSDVSYTNITADKFLGMADDGVITLNNNYNVTDSVTLTSSLKLVMNNFNLTTPNDLFILGADDITLEIQGDANSSITAGQSGQSSIVWGNNHTGSLIVTGGNYSADYAFVWCGTGQNGKVVFENATIVGVTTGPWISYGSNTELTIDNCTITSGGIGIYCATVVNATINDTKVTVNGDDAGSALEIKAGNVSVINSEFSTNNYLIDSSIGQSESGGSISAITVNNGYCGSAKVESVNVTIDENTVASVEGNASATPIVITSDNNYPITVSWEGHGNSDFSVIYGETKGDVTVGNVVAEVTDNVTDDSLSSGAIVTITGNAGLAGKTISNGTTLCVTGNVTVDSTTTVGENSTLEFMSSAVLNDFSSTIQLSNGASIRSNGASITASIANGTNVAILDGVSGNFTISQGSIAISGDFDSGSMTVNGEAKLTGNVSVDSGATLTIASGATLDLNGYTLTIAGELVNNGAVSITSGAIVVESTGSVSGNGTIDITGGTYTSNGATTTMTFVHSKNAMKMAEVEGTFQISRGSVAIGGINGDATITAGTITVTGQARLVSNVTLAGTLNVNEGASLVTGAFKLDASGATAVTNSGTITVSENGEMAVGSNNLTNVKTGTIEIYGTVSGTSIVNNGTISVLDNGTYSGVAFTGNGTIDMSGVSSDGVLGGTYGTTGTTDVQFPSDQVITLVSDTTLVNNMKMTFNGVLIIPEGMTLTISNTAVVILSGQTASIVNNGNIVIQSTGDNTGLNVTNGAKIQNNGTITVQYTPQNKDDSAVPNTLIIGSSSTDTGSAIVNNGTITVGERSEITINGYIVNSSEATIALNGEITSNTAKNTEILNAGTVDLNVKTTGELTISATAIGATVNVNSVYGNAVQIDDAGIVDDKTYANSNDTDVIRVVGLISNEYAIGGISVVASTIGGTSSGTVTYKTLDISGVVSGKYMGTSTSVPAVSGMGITIAGKITVSDSFTTANGMSLNLGMNENAMDLAVSGEMTIVNGTTVGTATTGSSVAVTGMITSAVDLSEVSNLALNAATYEIVTEETTGTSTVKTTTYYYTTLVKAISSGAENITVYGNVNVEADMTIPSGVTVTQSNGTITVSQGATLTVADGGVLANGNVNVEGTLYIETAATGFPSGKAVSEVYSSNGTDARYTNLVAAMDAAQSGDTVTLNPSGNGVTLTLSSFTIKEGVTLDTNGMPLTLVGATLTIDGTLFLNDGTAYSVGATQNGIESTIVLNGYIKSDSPMTYSANDAKYPAGAYYSTENGTYYWISTVANAAAIIDDVDSSTVDVYGAVSVGEISVTSKNTDPAIIYVRNGATVTGTVTIDNVDVQVIAGGKIVGGITDGVGTYSTVSDSVYGNTSFSNGASGLTVTGGADKATVTGTVYLESYSTDGALTVDGTAITSGSVTVGALYVNGTFTVSAGNVLIVNGTATVLGTLQTETEGTSTGNARIATMYVGCQNSNGEITVSGDAVVSGSVSLSNGNGAAVAYVSSGSTVPESFAGTGYVNTQFMVGGSLWITVYGTSAASIDYIEGPVENARFLGWATQADATSATISSGSISLGGNNAVLYAVIDEKIYDVTVYTDGGISSVAIDDILLFNESGGNMFTIKNLTAGEHRLTYTLKNGFQGEATMSIDGQVITGNTFTLSGTPADSKNIQVTIYLTGTEPADTTIVIEGGSNGGSDSLGLTDYLLIILVILIVIMAILVASRMMRS